MACPKEVQALAYAGRRGHSSCPVPDVLSLSALLLIILFATSISTATGFGAAVIAIPLCSLVLDVKVVIPLLALISFSTCTWLTLRDRQHVDWTELRRILLWVGISFPVGLVAYHYLPIARLKLLLGIFVTGVAVQGLWQLYRRRPRRPWNPVAGRCFLIAGGFVHGALASGGPLVVTYAHHALPDKSRFRATLLVNWMILNAIFVLSHFAGRDRQPSVLLLGLCSAPAVAGGIWIGQKLHHYASDRMFQALVSSTLLVSGISLLWK